MIEFRPLQFTDILDGSFALFRSSLRVMVPVVLLVMAPVQLVAAFAQREALSFGFTGILDDPTAADALLGSGGVTAGLLISLAVQMLIAPILAGVLVHIAGAHMFGRQVTMRQAVLATLGKSGWLVGAYLLIGLVRVLLLGLAFLAFAAGSAVGVTVLIVLGAAVFVGLTPLFAVITPAIMLESVAPVAAIRHAITLAQGAYWRVAGVMLGTSFVFNLLALLLAGIPNVIGVVGGLGFGWVLVGLASVLSQLIVAPLNASAMVLLHADLQMRQEGMDFDVVLGRMAVPA
ncbi:MAG: hypothetical protein ACR2HR_10045 [Euzebya sp.]